MKHPSIQFQKWGAPLFLAAMAVLSGCDLMHDDMLPCATDPKVTTVVNFVYDYNMDGEDLFDRQVGSVYLYVFDSEGKFISRHMKSRQDLDPYNPDFSMTFDNNASEIEMGRTYQFVAVASSSLDYDDDEDTPGFKVLRPLVPGESTISDYILRLNRDDKMFEDFDYDVIDYTQDYSGPDAMIDTVWTTRPDEVQVHTIPYLKAAFDSTDQLPDHVEEVKIPMMRITNSIEVGLTGPHFTADLLPSAYDIVIYFPHGNGTIDFVGSTAASDSTRAEQIPEISQPLYYRALRKTVDVYEDHGGTRADGDEEDGPKQYAIYATFGVSRLEYYDGAKLQVRHPVTHEVIAELDNLSQYLNRRGNTEYDDPQEYLDREHDFRVNLGLTAADELWWTQVGIGVHDWAVKDWYVDL